MLLDGDLNPKISDFGLAKLDEEEKTHISTRVAGTMSVTVSLHTYMQGFHIYVIFKIYLVSEF